MPKTFKFYDLNVFTSGDAGIFSIYSQAGSTLSKYGSNLYYATDTALPIADIDAALINVVALSDPITSFNLGITTSKYNSISYCYMPSKNTSIAINDFYTTLADISPIYFMSEGMTREWY